MSGIQGRCHCKKIQFEIKTPTEMFSHCHCESCRRTHGAAFVSWTSVPDEQFKITDGANLIHRYQSSPGVVWMSCGYCASPLLQTTENSPGRVYVAVSSLIDSMDRQAECHVSYEEKVDWFDGEDDLPKFKEKASDRLG